MKVYFIDKTGKNLRIKKLIEKNGILSVEHKDTYSFRTTKNDVVILSEYLENDANELLKKYHNLIVITNLKDSKTIWKFATEYQTIDIIDASCGDEYVAQRIAKLILD